MPHWPKLRGLPFTKQSLGHNHQRIQSFLNKLDNPEKLMPPVVHIAGTNGKGSTLALIRSIMQTSGYKVHAYTSPHLIHFNERIVIAGNYINDNKLHSLLEECRIAVADQHITLFEAATIVAFLAFSRSKADITLIEVGMGGRLDPTNVISRPILTIITSISLDHTEYLGPTVEIIAGEKAGIMKSYVPCVVAQQERSVMRILESHAIMKEAPLYRYGMEWDCYKQNNSITFRSSLNSIAFPLPSLAGDHQIANTGNAIAACTILSGKYNFRISKENIATGLQSVYWPARLEKIQHGRLVSMLPKGWTLFLDGAHNSGGAKILSDWIESNFAHGVYIIIGLTRNKNIELFLQHLKPHIRLLCAVCVKSEPNAVTASFLREKANTMGIKAVECESMSNAILCHILKTFDTKVQTILICGSLFLARDLAIENYSSTI